MTEPFNFVSGIGYQPEALHAEVVNYLLNATGGEGERFARDMLTTGGLDPRSWPEAIANIWREKS